MRSWKVCLAILFLCVSVVPEPTAQAARFDAGVPVPPYVQAEAAVLMDADTGRVLYEKKADRTMRIASITKVMTAILAIEWGDLGRIVKVSPHAVGTEGSSIYLKAGERISLEHLIYGLMLRSGNDAAVSIAVHVAGTEEDFVQLMNLKAKQLGMSRTRFANPHGLDTSPDHYSTARDMALLTSYALKNPVFQEIVQTRTKKVPWEGQTWDRVWHNKNKMLALYKGADGVKTGYTRLAKRTLISSATREGQQLIVVTLNDPNDWQDHAALLDYGFANYPKHEILAQGSAIKSPYRSSSLLSEWKFEVLGSCHYPLAPGEEALVDWQWQNYAPWREVKKRLKTGQTIRVIGYVQVTFQGKTIRVLPVQLQPTDVSLGR